MMKDHFNKHTDNLYLITGLKEVLVDMNTDKARKY